MIRGTTPDYLLTIPDYDLTGTTNYVTISQPGHMTGTYQLTLTGSRLEVDFEEGSSTIAFRMTQEETLKFRSGSADVQVRFIDAEGEALATEYGKITVGPVLLEKVIAYDG